MAVKIVKRAGLPADDEKALKDEVSDEFFGNAMRSASCASTCLFVSIVVRLGSSLTALLEKVGLE